MRDGKQRRLRWAAAAIIVAAVATAAGWVLTNRTTPTRPNPVASTPTEPSSYAARAPTVPLSSPVTFTLHDVRRGKDVSVYAQFPLAPGPWPLIVFSHGNQSGGRAMAGLFAGWADHGYVCVAPTHDDSVSMRAAAEAAGAPPDSLPAAGMIAPRGAGTDSVLNRARDLSFVIDSADAIESTLHVRISRDRIGVGGHSSGAYTAMLVGGTAAEMDGVPRSAVDPRPRAFLILGTLGSGQGGLTPDSWRAFTRPLMNVTGSLDRVPRGQTPQQKREPFALSPPGEKFEVFLVGANHGTFTCDPADTFYLKQLGGTAEQQRVLFGDIHDVTLAFWDAELKGSADAAAYLRSGDVARRTGGRMTIEWR